MNPLYYEDVGIQVAYTDDQLFRESEVLNPRHKHQEEDEELNEAMLE